MKKNLQNITAVLTVKAILVIAASFLLLNTYAQGVSKIGSVSVWPTRTVCIPQSGTTTVTYTIGSVRSANGTFNGTYTVSGLPVGVTASAIPGFTANGNTAFPNRTLTLTISSSAPVSITAFNVILSDGADAASAKGMLQLMAPPVLPSFSDVTVNSDLGMCGSSQSFGTTTGGAITYKIGSAVITSPHVFPIGSTTVTVEASNACGVRSTTFNVTVIDAEIPTITGPGHISKAADAAGCSSIVTYDVLADDNCRGVVLNQATGLPSGASFPLGITKNTFTAIDAFGNSATYTFNVTITSDLTVDAGADAQTFFGYGPTQTVNRMATASAGAGTYSFEWSMNRPMLCNQLNDAGDESFTAGTCVFNTCPSLGSPSCSGSASLSATLIQPADACVIVTDAIGCKAGDCFHINAQDVRCTSGGSKIVRISVCHVSNGTANRSVQLCISPVAAQLANTNSYLGNCISGSNKTGEEESITTQVGEFQMEVYPNPANNVLNIEFATFAADNYRAMLFDNLGRKVLADEGTAFEEGNRLSLPVHTLSPGIYYLNLQVGDKSSSTKVVVRR
jgi:hypothetical protein